MNPFVSLAMFWIVAMVVLLIVEAAVPGLVSIWFALGALAAGLAALCRAPLWLQIVLFILVSAATLYFTRPLVKKHVNAKAQPTNADTVIGKECIVTERIDNILGTGAAKAEGKFWTAVSYDDNMIIEPGCRASVLEIRGVKLVVKPLSAEGKEQ